MIRSIDFDHEAGVLRPGAFRGVLSLIEQIVNAVYSEYRELSIFSVKFT
jgi:hypothetical protein